MDLEKSKILLLSAKQRPSVSSSPTFDIFHVWFTHMSSEGKQVHKRRMVHNPTHVFHNYSVHGFIFFHRNRLYFAQQEKIYTVWHFPLTIWSHFRLPLLQFILVSCVCAALLYTVVNILLLPIDRKRASTDDSWTHGPLPSDLNSPRPVSLQSCAALPKPLKSGGVFKRL